MLVLSTHASRAATAVRALLAVALVVVVVSPLLSVRHATTSEAADAALDDPDAAVPAVRSAMLSYLASWSVVVVVLMLALTISCADAKGGCASGCWTNSRQKEVAIIPRAQAALCYVM